jgi:ubiquinone/menaquinone biosynthesis C-methylase UbiE
MNTKPLSEKVKGLYAIGHAKWYDPFKKLWDKIVARKAENDLIAFLKENINENTRILELGCGTALNLGKIFKFNLKYKSYLGLDFSTDMLKLSKNKFANVSNIEFRQKDITNLGDINEKFDIIICTWVLSHLGSPSHVINQAQELLAPHGEMFLIFYSKPRWYVNFWFYPFAKYLFKTNSLTDKEVSQFKNVHKKHKSFADLTTSIIIYK